MEETETQATKFLFNAARDKNPTAIRAAIDAGALIDDYDITGSTPLIYAVCGNDRASVETLLSLGADINQQAKASGETPLFSAVSHGNYEMAELLLKRGAKPDIADKIQQTPMHYAAFNGLTEIAQLLLHHKANPEALDNGHQTPLEIAREEGHADIIKLLERHSHAAKSRLRVDIMRVAPANSSLRVDVMRVVPAQNGHTHKLRDAKNGTPAKNGRH